MRHLLFAARRDFVPALGALVIAALLPLAPPAAAQPAVAAPSSWPDRPIRIIVPYGAGQGADVLARHVAQELSKSLGQAFIVENKAGAGGNIGTAAAAKSAPDGYTLLLGTNATNAANEFLYPSLGYNPTTDFDSVALIGMLPMVISTSAADLPTNGIAELIARARAKPDKIDVGLPSTTASVVFAQFVKSAQAPLFAVKYKSSSQSMTDVVGGQIPVVIDTLTATRPFVQSGKLRALGVTSAEASEMLPGVKSVAEQGVPGFEIVAWNALFAPRGTPPAVLAKLGEHIQRVVQNPETRRRLADIGVEARFMGPADLSRFVRDERSKWRDVIQAGNIRVD